MAKARKITEPTTGLSAQVHRALREGALYVFGALAFILWFALFTYDPADPGFSQATRPMPFCTSTPAVAWLNPGSVGS